jgi:PBP1b-binding outer membrane lipoprotein LpoB
MKAFVPVAAFAVLLSGCVTTPATQAEIESCQEMERDMGLNQTHDHNEMKNQGRNPMNLSHARCVEILGKS